MIHIRAVQSTVFHDLRPFQLFFPYDVFQIFRSYVYHILNGERKNPSRSKLLAICVAMKMDIKETQYFLRAAQVPVLYPRNQRDCIILYGLEQGASVMELNETLYTMQFELLE